MEFGSFEYHELTVIMSLFYAFYVESDVFLMELQAIISSPFISFC